MSDWIADSSITGIVRVSVCPLFILSIAGSLELAVSIALLSSTLEELYDEIEVRQSTTAQKADDLYPTLQLTEISSAAKPVVLSLINRDVAIGELNSVVIRMHVRAP